MAFTRKAAVAALAVCAASLGLHSDQTPKPSTARISKQWSETRLGPAMTVSEACAITNWQFSTQSEWKEPDPITFPEPGLGARRLMGPMYGLSFQFYLPLHFNSNPLTPFPVHLDLHSHGERKWSLKNSQGFARLLARNQSQSFDNRSCWCLNTTAQYGLAHNESLGAPYYMTDNFSYVPGCPMADCDFADDFPGLVVMPQCWKGSESLGWTDACLEAAKNITAWIIENYNGNAEKVIVSGTSEGGEGALAFASKYPKLVSAVIVTDAPNATVQPDLDGIPVYITGDASHASIAGIDNLVVDLNNRTSGETRYTRFVTAPGAADPGYRAEDGHSSDIAYRCEGTWQWARSKNNDGARTEWGLGPNPMVNMGSR